MKAAIKRLAIRRILEKQALKLADRIDDDLLDRVEMQTRILAYIAIAGALLVILERATIFCSRS